MTKAAKANNEVTFEVIAHIHSDFKSKFGAPRQSGLVEELSAQIVFEPRFSSELPFRGIEQYSHLWLLWQFSLSDASKSLTARPPRLGGNKRMGVFATRSPFRPNPIGLSCVRLKAVSFDERLGTVLEVSGADLIDGTPILDIKPYIKYTDCREDAVSGFARKPTQIKVEAPDKLLERVSEDKRAALLRVLALDPRPAYHDDPNRIYGFGFADYEVKFKVDGELLTVVDIKIN